MGLDNFKSDSGKSGSSKENQETSATHEDDGVLKWAKQRFCNDESVNARRIKYQIKSVGVKWAYTFSQRRFSSGELVMYGAGPKLSQDSECVAVFTTIQSLFDESVTNATEPIEVTVWDIEDNEIKNVGREVEYEENWEKELFEVIAYLAYEDIIKES